MADQAVAIQRQIITESSITLVCENRMSYSWRQCSTVNCFDDSKILLTKFSGVFSASHTAIFGRSRITLG